ncbi:hypothetical protein AAG570_004623, partial [Ranatra chinensis]
GSKFSLEPSLDDTSSLLGEGSRRSLAETSITSTADLSVFSSAPRSQGGGDDNHSLDTDSGPPTPTPRSPDILRIYVPYESPQHNGDLPRPPTQLDNKIRILVMDQSPPVDENTPIVELASPFRVEHPVDLK